MNDRQYESNSQQRILKILMCLFGHEVQGLSPGELARIAETTPAETTRDLANLRIAGLAEQIEDTGRWRLTPRLPQRALAMLHAIDNARQKLAEISQRYTRSI